MQLNQSIRPFYVASATTSFLFFSISTCLPVFANDILGDTVISDLSVEGSKIKFDNDANLFEFRNGADRFDFWHQDPGQWVWSHGAAPTDVMSLDSDNVLSLYDLGATTATPSIILDPGNPDVSPKVLPMISIGGSEVITVANSAALLSQGFVTRNPSNAGSVNSLLLDGSYGSTGTIPQEGAGTRMMWYPEKAAFRAGAAYQDGWDDINIGDYSVAMGINNMVSGTNSMSWGFANNVTGFNASASGRANTVAGFNSMAWGYGNHIATSSTATTWGYSNTITSGNAATAWGAYNTVLGDQATAWGTQNLASSAFVTVMGTGNRGGSLDSEPWDWYEIDPLLEVGNAGKIFNRSGELSNALTILKNGQTTLTNKHWKTAVAAGGAATADVVATSEDVPDKNGADITDPNDYYSSGNALVVEGHTILQGKVIISSPQGDISMGTYQ